MRETRGKEREDAYLGIDTSCYTTSVLFMDRQGRVLSEARRLLEVKPGRCGLQQSEMVYQHTRNLPDLMEQATAGHRFRLLGIGVSARPRPLADSYMPAFWPGRGWRAPWRRCIRCHSGKSAIKRTTWRLRCGLPADRGKIGSCFFTPPAGQRICS